MAAEFGWWPMSPWLSPGAAWFIFFNVVVGAIAAMSSWGQQDDREAGARRKLVRTASTVVLDSLRSISIFSFHSAGDYSVAYSAPAPQLHRVQHQYYTFQEQETQEVSMVAPQLREPEAISVAEEEDVVLPHSAPVAAAAAVAPDATATASENQMEDGESPSISLDEAYALARARWQSPTAAAPDTVARVPGAEVNVRAYGRGRGAEEVDGKAEVNARAERFIRQFREELKLERINSILNYTHALRGGAAAAPR